MLRRESGQALPLGLALVLFGVFGALVLFNTGKVTTDKTKLVNAADAAAYSGSVWQARALNYQAYTNRAMVANQVSIAQAVTLQSWASYGAITSENIATVLRPIPVANIFATALEQAMTVAEQVLGPLAQGMVIVIDPILDGLSMSQQAMLLALFPPRLKSSRPLPRNRIHVFLLRLDTPYSVWAGILKAGATLPMTSKRLIRSR